MNIERFGALAASFGSRISRWPRGEWRAATWFLICHMKSAQQILSKEQRLDRLLERTPTPPVSEGLKRRLLEAAPKSSDVFIAANWFTTACLSAGIAGVCIAGMVTGVGLSSITSGTFFATSTPDPAEDALATFRDYAGIGDR